MYFVSSQIVSTFTSEYTPPAPTDIDSAYKWNIKLYHRSGGLKKEYLFGQADSALKNFKFELNKTGCGAGSIELAFIDFPVDADDYCEIYYNGTKIYRGIVDITPDIRGGLIEFIPQWRRLDELLYNGIFTTQTAAQILQTVIEATDDNSLITWNGSSVYINTGSTDTYSVTYEYEKAKKVIDDTVSKLDDRYWGVTADNIFYVKELDSVLDADLFYSDNVAYSDIEFEIDYSGIKATRYKVLKKVSGSSSTVLIGEVGYSSGTYPPLPIEKLFRIKEDKITVSEVLSDAEALDYAYSLLKSFQPIESITVNNINLLRYVPQIGKLIRVQDKEETQLTTIVNCDSVLGWTNATLDSVDYVEGVGSVYFNGTVSGDGMQYNFPKQMRYLLVSKIGFMIKSAESGRKLSVKITYGTNYRDGGYSAGIYSDNAYCENEIVSDETTETYTINTIYIPSANVWHYVEFDMTEPIVSIEFYFNTNPTTTTKVNVDRIQVMRPYRKQYQDNIIQINYDIGISGEKITMKLNSYDPKANDKLFDLENKINTLETALRSS